MTEHISPEVYLELGKLGLSYVEVKRLIDEAMKLSADQHQMRAQGKVVIRGSKRVLVYDCGIDGMDWRVFIEDTEVWTADKLVREGLAILEWYSRNRHSGDGGPNFYEWSFEARRYIDSQKGG